MRRGDIFPDDGPEYEKPEVAAGVDEESQVERMRRLHNVFATDMEVLFKCFGRTIELPRLKQ
jgi:hypothetical protein